MAEQNMARPLDHTLFYDQIDEPKEEVPVVELTVWKEDEDLSNSFHELSSNNPVKEMENVEIIPMNRNLLNDSSASSHLITRQEQRAVINWAFKVSRENLSERRFIAAIRGSPGIGKSWSALLYIRKLMQQKIGRRPVQM
jgi:pantothenate kinase